MMKTPTFFGTLFAFLLGYALRMTESFVLNVSSNSTYISTDNPAYWGYGIVILLAIAVSMGFYLLERSHNEKAVEEQKNLTKAINKLTDYLENANKRGHSGESKPTEPTK